MPASRPQILKFRNFHEGLGVSKYIGSPDSYAKAVGVDIWSEPGVVQAQQALAKDSGATVVDLIRCSVFASNGASYHFGDAGKIYKRTSGGSWSVLTTVTATPTILGAAEHSDGFIYFTYANKVGTVQVSNDAIVEVAETLTNTNSNFGPVIYHEKRDTLFIGNLELVASIDSASAFAADALDLKSNYEVRDIVPDDIDVIAGATDLDNGARSILVKWDGTSSSWQESWFFNEPILWIANKLGAIYILGGNKGKLYKFPDLENPITQIPGSYSSTATLAAHNFSKVIYDGFLMFGLYDGGAGNPFPNGIYVYGSKNGRFYSSSLNSAEYIISPDKTTGIVIGGISTDGSNLYVAWKDGATYGVDKIDFSAKYASAYIEFRLNNLKREVKKTFGRMPCNFEPLPASCSLTAKYKVDHGASFDSIAVANVTNSVNDEEKFDLKNKVSGTQTNEGEVFQARLDFGVNGNNSPKVEQLAIVFQFQDLK